jgi:hypothetical protein
MSDSSSAQFGEGQSMRKRVRDAQEAAISLAFEESNRLIKEVDRLLGRVEAIAERTQEDSAGAAVPLVEVAEQTRATLLQLAKTIRQDIEEAGKRERINVAEAVREGAVAAAQEAAAKTIRDAAASTVAQVNKLIGEAAGKAAEQIGTAIAAETAPLLERHQHANRNTGETHPAGSGMSWPKVLVLAVLTAALVCIGQRIVYPILANRPAGTYGEKVWDKAVTASWSKLSQEAQATLNNAAAEVAKKDR